MADFRKMLYALAIVALLAAFTVPANAQGMNCTSPTGSNAAIRQGGFTELTGYFDIECEAQATTTTPVGQGVKQGTLRITVVGTTLTSRVVDTSRGVTFVESLLLVDKPTPGGRPGNFGQLPCGTESNDTSPGLPGVCNIISTGNPDETYDGCSAMQTCTTGFSGDRPNIFQGRQSTDTATCPIATCVEFKAVPLDPPGTNKKRVFRFTNFRVNAAALAVGSIVIMQASVVDSQTAFNLPLEKRAEVGQVVASAPATTIDPDNFVLCVSEDQSPAGSVIISEGSGGSSIWRARNTVVQRDNSSNYLGNNFTNYNGGTTINSVDDPQNNPDGGYFTESGFVFGCDAVSNCLTITSASVLTNGLHLAGVATQGTLLIFPVTPNPDVTNISISWPSTVPLVSNFVTTGFLSRVSYPDPTILIYEVGHTQPFLNEVATITPTITYNAIIPGPTSFGAGSAILAPFGASVNGTFTPNSSPRYPRFAGALGGADQTLFAIGNCTCNLLFPWVVSSNSYATGIAISNTSKDPTNALLGLSGKPVTAFTAVQQEGIVDLYLFGTNSAGSSTVATLSETSPSIPSGTSATFVVNGVSGGFQGYAIAQAQFQYCHGVAFLFSTTPSVPPMSYLGLVMDKANLFGFGGNLPPSGIGSITSGFGGELRRTTNVQSDRMDH